jgi:hypothetical protein
MDCIRFGVGSQTIIDPLQVGRIFLPNIFPARQYSLA